MENKRQFFFLKFSSWLVCRAMRMRNAYKICMHFFFLTSVNRNEIVIIMMGDERIVLEILYSAGSTESILQLTMYNVFNSRRATPSPTYTAFTQFHIRARAGAAAEPSTCNFLRRFVFILSFFPRSQCIISINWIALTHSLVPHPLRTPFIFCFIWLVYTWKWIIAWPRRAHKLRL